MKKVFLIASVCCALVSCNNSNNSQNAESSAETEVKTEQCTNQKADFESPDYKIYALRGKVKTVVTYSQESNKDFNNKISKEFGDTIKFSSDGKIISDKYFVRVGFDDWERKESRDENGQLLGFDLDDEEANTSLFYNNDGFLEKLNDCSSEHSTDFTFTYNSDYELIKSEKTFCYFYDEGDNCMSDGTSTEYTILERDNKGNWTKRGYHSFITPTCNDNTEELYVLEVRDIVYY
ncbi:MAG: hypothetical protein MJ211_09835 [Bacteroidales bacterium]|nr:hypothetical protein [Bacteroidales bacterium]